MGSGESPSKAQETSRPECRRRAARAGYLRGSRQHYQKRGTLPHPRASRERGRRLATQETHRTHHAGPGLQLRFLRVEKDLSAAETLAHSHEDEVPAMQHSIVQEIHGRKEKAKLFLHELPDPV